MKMLRLNRGAEGAILRVSPICLQNHGTPVWFRDLKVRRIEAGANRDTM
ncbi:MAG: hypothetical protein HY822_10250 [Acidobacteria bacterium]|nr:hypothetical protein [Acidobacteriota bacterium]